MFTGHHCDVFKQFRNQSPGIDTRSLLNSEVSKQILKPDENVSKQIMKPAISLQFKCIKYKKLRKKI